MQIKQQDGVRHMNLRGGVQYANSLVCIHIPFTSPVVEYIAEQGKQLTFYSVLIVKAWLTEGRQWVPSRITELNSITVKITSKGSRTICIICVGQSLFFVDCVYS